MNFLSVDGISKSFGERVLFRDISFGIEKGQKVALVGVNGSGKSTLLKILAGLEAPETGEVVVSNDVTVAYLGQQPEFDNDLSILQAVLQGNDETSNLLRDYEMAVLTSGDSPEAMERMAHLISEMDKHNAWNYESQVKEILGKLGLHDLNKEIGTLSGGQKKRVGLAKALIEKPDLLILDEPTNHLDLEAIEWLEDFLSSSQMGLILVTHDRYFLESVTSEIIEIDREQVYKYAGNYSYFLEKKAEREQNLQIEKQKATSLYKKELDWINRQPKARGTKAKYRIDAFKETKKLAHQNLNRSQLELDVVNKRQGGKVLELHGISKSFGDQQVIRPFNYIFKKGERIGIVGKNGTGKSTFLNLITGNLSPDHGEVEVGKTTEIGYYKQQEPNFKAGQKVIDVVQEIAEVVTMSSGQQMTASKFLTLFNFPVKAQHDYVDKLSGGEKRRLQLLQVLIKNPNFLILDEPTNDLDLITLRTLEDFLQSFGGCLIIVSHDRYFMDRLVDHLFVFTRNQAIEDFPGNYSIYREYVREQEQEEKGGKQEKEKTEKVKTEQARKMSYKEKREFENLDQEISDLNAQKEKLMAQLNSGESDHEQLRVWGEELEQVEASLDEKEMRWLELSELE